MSVFENIKYLLDRNNIEYKFLEHEIVTSSEHAALVRGVELKTGAKAMVAKAKDTYILLVLPGDKKINWKLLKKALGIKDISLAPIEEAEKVSGCKRNSMPPFGNLLGLKTYVDKALLENVWINFNPGSLTHSIQMRTVDWVNLVRPEIISFSLI